MCAVLMLGGGGDNTNECHEKKDKTQNENKMTVNLMITSTHGKLNSERVQVQVNGNVQMETNEMGRDRSLTEITVHKHD